MSVIYDQADQEIHQMAVKIIEDHHKELVMPDGTFARLCILTARNKEKECDDPPIKDGRYPAIGVISVIPYKQRVDKRADAEIVLDELAWADLAEPQQRALLDHLITHLEITAKDGVVQTDDVGRPKLQLRLCDWFLKGFRSIAQRYGSDAPEVIAARVFEERHGDVALATSEKLFI